MKPSHHFVWVGAALLILFGFFGISREAPRTAVAAAAPDTLPGFVVPASLGNEHDRILSGLGSAARETGRIGEAARTLRAALEPHMDKEEAYVLPPLALLPSLAQGETWPQMWEILPVTDRLRELLPGMIEEHRAIAAAADDLAAVARAERRSDIVELANEIRAHALTEEQITYPAAILVGEVVETRLDFLGVNLDAPR
jgi:hypothetical protein